MVSAVLLLFFLSAAFADGPAKQVVNTAWWPAGTEKKEESVGIISREMLWMTGMMESNSTVDANIHQEILDLSDIAKAGNTSLQNLLGCLVNTRKGLKQQPALTAFRKYVGHDMPVTFASLNGEWPFFNSSITCVASRILQQPSSFAYGAARARSAGAMITVSAEGGLAQTVTDLEGVLVKANPSGPTQLVDCMVFLQRIQDSAAVKAALNGVMPYGPAPAMTVVQSKLDDETDVRMQCTATTKPSRAIDTHNSYAVKANGLVYVSGFAGQAVNGSDAFGALEEVLTKAGSGLQLAVNCIFFVDRPGHMQDIFAGFFNTFNANYSPPPSRTEFIGRGECRDCAVITKCIAAMP